MTLLAEPKPARILHHRHSTLPTKVLTLGATMVDHNGGQALVPHKQIMIAIGTQNVPDMVSFNMPADAARDLFRRGLVMCDEVEGGIAA